MDFLANWSNLTIFSIWLGYSSINMSNPRVGKEFLTHAKQGYQTK